jgi:hypothetical protein
MVLHHHEFIGPLGTGQDTPSAIPGSRNQLSVHSRTCKQTSLNSLSVNIRELLAFRAGRGVKGTVEPLGLRAVDISLSAVGLIMSYYSDEGGDSR